jgi:hypothetical protein
MSTRLWFRLDEVVPLATHALTCPSQRITTAQIRAGARLRPALIWTTTDADDTLSSNGLPVWYDEDGHDHTAAAHSWRHPATGRRGTPHEADAERFLMLSARNGRHPLITLLRRGAQRGGHWFVVETDPAKAASPERFQILDHRDEIAPPQADWVSATVTADAVARRHYPALVADGYTVRGAGDVLARFDRPTVEQMVTDLHAVHTDTNPDTDPMPGEFPVLSFDANVAVVSWQHDDGVDERLVEIDRVHPDSTGHYAIGAYLWPWRPAATAGGRRA